MSAAPSEPTFAQALSEGTQFVSTLSQGSSPQSRFANLRSVQWRINLGILPSSCDSSIEDLRRVAADSRRRYAGLRRRLLVDPHFSKDDNKAPDLVIDNPLSQNPDSTWGRFFKNAELEKMVDQDLSRLYPEHGSYFQTMACQAMLRRILLLWCLRHPEYGYRQGMHELLAPFLYVLHVDAQRLSQVRELYEDVFSDKFDGMSFLESDLNFSKTASPVSSRRSTGNNENDFQEGGVKTYSSLDELDPEIRTIVLLSDAYGAEGELGVLLSEKFMEHDAYCMFDALMSGAYGVVAMADFFSPAPSIGSLTSLPPVIEASSALYHLLSIVDSSLHSHLVELGVEPQYFSLRWLRVLFGREFSLEDLLVIWDEIFASPNGKPVLGSENDMVCQFMILTSSRGAFIIAMAVSMLLQLRSSLLATENATLCLQRLLNFPENINVKKLIEKAKSLQALALDRSVFASPSSGTFGRSKPAHVRGYSISGGSVSPRTPLNLLSESYWEEKWRVLHKAEANNQRGSGDPISSGTKHQTVKERLSLTRTESAPSPAKTPNGKNSRLSVRRRLLEDLSKELGESEADFDKSSLSEIASNKTALSAEAEKSFVDQSGQNGLSEESEADFDKCSSTEIVSSKFPLSVHVQKGFVDDQSGQNGLAGDSCLDRHISSEENSLIFSASTSPCSRAQDHENDSEKSSVSSNSCIYENEDEINNPEPCSSTVSDNPPIMDSKLEEESTEKILSDPGGNAKQVTNPKERKPLSGKLQWFWRFGRNNGEGTSEKGGNSEAQASLNSPSGASNVDECYNSCGVNGTLDNTLDKNVTGTLRNLGQSMLENIQVIESVFQQDRGQVGSLENLSKTLLSGKGQVTAMAALKELRKISNLLSQM